VLLAGCSILYNPDNLPEPLDAPEPDAPTDAEIDVNPDLFDITAIEPTTIDEGVGSDGGRHAMFVLRGTSILEGQASVTVAFVADTSGDGGIPVTMPPAPADIDFAVGAGNTRAAVTMPIPVIPELIDGRTLTMRITVSQGGVDKSQDVSIRGLDELTLAAPADHARALYSRITVASNVRFTGADPILLHATAGITLDAIANVDAIGTSAGAHGGPAGANNEPGGYAPGGGGSGTNAALLGLNNGSGGGGGGFGSVAIMGSGSMAGSAGQETGNDMLVPIETGPNAAGNRGNGGGGGGNGLLNAAGGVGGAGGGTLYLRAGGDLTVNAMGGLRASGGNGTTAQGSGGGGGSGGALLVRSGGTIVSSTRWLSAPAGSGGTGGVNPGGAGGLGRIRIDAADGDVGSAMSNNPVPVRGPTWSRSVPLITGTSPFTAQLRGDADRAFGLRLNGDPMGSAMPGVGDTVNVPDITLEPGRNVLCAVAEAGELGEESLSCIDVFYTGS
jgi:hypothetical protein